MTAPSSQCNDPVCPVSLAALFLSVYRDTNVDIYSLFTVLVVPAGIVVGLNFLVSFHFRMYILHILRPL